MSSSNAPALSTPAPRYLTPEASNVLGFWWLSIVTTIVLMATMWPSIFPESSSGGLASTASYLITIISSVLVALGIWCSMGFVRGQPWSARAMRLITMIGLGVGLAGVGYFLYSVAFAPTPNNAPSFFGPSGVLSGILWSLIILLPFIFGLTLIFGLMNDAIDDWFNPQPTMYTRTSSNLRIDPQTAALLAGGADLTGEAQILDDVDEALGVTDQNAAYADDQSVEVIGSAEEDLSVEVISDAGGQATSDSMEELAALEEALTEDAGKKAKKAAAKKKEENKYDAGKGDAPLAVDDDFKL